MLRARWARRLSGAREATPTDSDTAAGGALTLADTSEPALVASSPGADGTAPTTAGDSSTADAAGTSRRALMKQGLWLMAGAAGVGLAGTGVTAGTKSPSPAAAPVHPAAAGPTRLTLYVRDIRFAAHAARPGALPDGSSVASPHGELRDASGAHVGSFAAGTLAGSGGHIAFQRFTLADGSLIGMGSGHLEDEEYAVVGGTGRYAGAAGSYRTALRPGDHGNDAEFAIHVTGTKG